MRGKRRLKIHASYFIPLLLVLLLIGASLPNATAHANILLDIDLSYDPILKENVIKKAREFSNSTLPIKRFDYDYELITVVFNSSRDLYVMVDPSDYSIKGFRDDSLITKGEEKFDASQRKTIAQQVFDSLPKKFQDQMVYGGENKQYSGIYRHLWYRQVDGIYVANDMLIVEVNPITGKVVSWRVTPFIVPKESIDPIPRISGSVAEEIALLRFDGKRVEYNPILIIEGAIPVWIVKVKGLYPFFVAIDARDGFVRYSGGIKSEIPQGYAMGGNIQVVESEEIKKIYAS